MLAKERGLAQQYSHGMYSAFFQKNRDIGDDDVIIDVAVSVGLDRSEVEAALASPERRARHAEDLRRAVELGVSAVPSFLIGEKLIPGVADARRLLAAVDELTQAGATP